MVCLLAGGSKMICSNQLKIRDFVRCHTSRFFNPRHTHSWMNVRQVVIMRSKDTLLARIKNTGNLPTLPHILLKLLALCNDDDVQLTDVANIVRKDPAICTEVLRLVNSAYYGLTQAITDIGQAVVYLGAQTIQDLAVTMSIHQAFQANGRTGPVCDTEKIWYHSLLSATIAKRIQAKNSLADGDDIYLAGLLHDIGKLLLASTFPEEYRTISLAAEGDVEALEQHHIGISHGEVGAWLVGRWGLHSLVGDAILYHHHPVDQITNALPPVQIVYCANLLAGPGGAADHYDICRTILGLPPDTIDDLVEGASREVEQMAAQLGISAPTASDSCRQEECGAHATKQLAVHIRNISLLTTLLDSLGQATDLNEIIGSVERALQLLFGLDRSIFLLPDRERLQLTGTSSTANPLHTTSTAIRLPIANSTSRIVAGFTGMGAPCQLEQQEQGGNLADLQLLRLFGGALLLIPLVAGRRPVGCILAEATAGQTLEQDDIQLLQTLSHQVALRLQLESHKQLQAQQLQAERTAAVALAARKFAHEINNPLGIISNYLTGLQLKLGDREEVHNELSSIEEEIQRLAAMVGQMHMFAQAPLSDFEPTDLNELLPPLVHLCRLSFFPTPARSISFVPSTGLPAISTSRNGIKQILINLIKNSAEAMNDGGRVVIRTKAADGYGAAIVVSDTGPGLPEKVQAHLYEPLITTKTSGHCGLGLSIVRKGVQDLGGRLECTSGSGGTTFTIFLPHAPAFPMNSR